MEIGEAKTMSKWLMGLGIVLIILGLIGFFAMEAIASALTIVLGVLLTIGGLMIIVFGAMAPTGKEKAMYITVGIIALIIGLLMAIYYHQAAAVLALILGVYFFIAGIVKILVAFGSEYKGILFILGIIEFIMGIMIIIGWPNASWVLGLFISLDLLFGGIWMVLVSKEINREIAAYE